MLDVIYDIFSFVCSFFALYFGLISIFCIFGKRKENDTDNKLKFAVLIAARNEEECIQNSINSLKSQDYPKELLDIYVIPNNCTDDTEIVSKKAGANIISPPEYVKNKGLALKFAMDYLQDEYDAFVVFDADNEVNSDFILSMNKTLNNGYRVAKSRIIAKNRNQSWVATCYDIHFCTANQFLNRARVRLGLSARIIGTGFAVKTEFLKEIGGFNTQTITEDAEFFAICALNGEKVGFCENAIAYDEQPLDFKTSLVQRRRWMSGIMQVFDYKKTQLLKGVVHKKTSAYSFDALVQLSFCYVQALLPFAIVILFFSSPTTFINDVILLSTKGYLCIISTAILVLSLEKRFEFSINIILGILLYPFFVLSFIPLQTISIFKKTTQWREIKHTGVACEKKKFRYHFLTEHT